MLRLRLTSHLVGPLGAGSDLYGLSGVEGWWHGIGWREVSKGRSGPPQADEEPDHLRRALKRGNMSSFFLVE